MERISFRLMRLEDIPRLLGWLSQPYLVDAWLNGSPLRREETEGKYARRIDGRDPTRPFLILLEGIEIGYIQSYLWRDYPLDSEPFTERERAAASLDIFIGEEKLLGKGIGPIAITEFLRTVLFNTYKADECLIAPLARNTRAIRAYTKAGFRRVRLLEHPREPSTVQLMTITRQEVFSERIRR